MAAIIFLAWCLAGGMIEVPQLAACIGLCVLAGLVCLLPEPFHDGVAVAFFVLIPPAVYLLLESMTHELDTLYAGPVILGLILFWIIYSFFFFLTGHMSIGFVTATVLIIIAGTANYYVLEFRSNPILPWDLSSVGTAFSVADNFTFKGSLALFISITGMCVLCAFALKCRVSLPGRFRIIGVLATLILGFAFCRFVQTDLCFDAFGMYDIPFTQWANYRHDGYFIGFIQNLKYLRVEMPEGYSPETAAALIESYSSSEDDTTAHNRPDIIVVMNEAFSDLGVLGDLQTSQPVMPYFDSLIGSEDTVTGTLYVSVLGGNTANTEFEFLTGSSMAFLPSGSIPFQQFIMDDTPSMARMLSGDGYAAIGSHPYGASGWNRENVYPRLGFAQSYFKNDFTTYEQLRIYLSDAADYEMLERISREHAGEDLFQFNVTMQNHGSYFRTYDNFTPYISLNGRPLGSWPKAETYISLINTSDAALRGLIEYYENCGEDTIIVFFGDHQPSLLESSFFTELLGRPVDQLSYEETAKRYQVPFLIWANYDIEEATDVVTSVNYLSLLMSETCGLETSNYMDFLARIREDYPVVTANFYYDAEGHFHRIDGLDSLPQELRDYALVQYGLMNDPEELEGYFVRG